MQNTSYTRWLRWGVIGALFLIPLVPFLVGNGQFLPQMFFPFITGKNFIFRILIGVALLCYTLLALREPKYRPSPSLLMWAALAFVAWMGIATLFSVDPIKSFWSNFERMEGYLGLLHLFVFFVIAGAMFSAEKLWERFFNTTIAISAVQGLWALGQIMGWLEISSQSGSRADTTFGNATYLAVYLLIHFFLTLFMLARTQKSDVGLRYAYGAALVLQFCGILFTETRGAILGLAAGLLIAGLYYLFAQRSAGSATVRKVVIGGMIGVLALGGLIFALRDTTLVQNIPGLRRVASITLSETTVVSRMQYIWPMAVKGSMERPLVGWGQENFNFIFNKYYDPGMYAQEAWFDRAHNQFLDWLVAGGVPAFLLHLSLYILGVAAILRSQLGSAERAALLGLLGAYAFNNSFVFDNLVSAVYFWALLAYLHAQGALRAPSRYFSRPLGDHALAVAAPLVAIVILGGVWAFNAPGFARAAALVDALRMQTQVRDESGSARVGARNPQENLAAFKQALGPTLWPGNPIGHQEAVEQMLQYASNIAPNTSVNPTAKQEIFETAYNAITGLLVERKDDARLELFASVFMAQVGLSGEAVQHLGRAQELSPRKQQILFQVGTLNFALGNKDAAVAAFREAFELEPTYPTARLYYVAALRATDRGTEADALLVERFETATPDSAELAQIYRGFRLYAAEGDIWKARVEKDPKNTDLRLGLASTYFAACNIPSTISVLRDIVEIAPTAAPQMQELISQIESGSLKCGQ